jgi:predicted P-loop ATPase
MSSDWKSKLLATSSGIPRALLANAIAALREAPVWLFVLAYDEFAGETVIRAAPPWDPRIRTWNRRSWIPHDDLLTAEWLQREGIAVNAAVAAQAIEAVARDAAFHPVIEYLDNLQHDGRPRVETWLSEYMGASQSAYHREVGKTILVAAVARIFDPGCKVDIVPIFEGPQGARKSTAVKTLFQPWFSDELADLGSKDAAMQTRGVWGVEVSELDAMSRGEVSRIKAFISRTRDRFRPPYGSRVIESPRTCVFWGTTNADGYLKDETGGRRFLPIKVGKINVERLAQDRDQLWAEAVRLYLEGNPWWITNKQVLADAERHQRDRYIGDPWEGLVGSFIDRRNEVAITEILQDAVHLDKGRWGQAEQNRIARCLRSFGWVRLQVRTGDKREWKYRRPVTCADETGNEGEQFGNVTPLKVVTTNNR